MAITRTPSALTSQKTTEKLTNKTVLPPRDLLVKLPRRGRFRRKPPKYQKKVHIRAVNTRSTLVQFGFVWFSSETVHASSLVSNVYLRNGD